MSLDPLVHGYFEVKTQWSKTLGHVVAGLPDKFNISTTGS